MAKPERTLFPREFFKEIDFRFRLRILFSRFLNESPRKSKRRVFELYHLTDDEIIAQLKEAYPQRQEESTDNRLKTSKGRFKKIAVKLGPIAADTYLDVGAGDGIFTLAVAQAWYIDHVFACDTTMYGGIETRIGRFYLSTPNDLLPHLPVPMDLISMIQVLHHARDPVALIQAAHQMLNPGGHLLIKEHDVSSPSMHQLITIEHALYHLIKEDDLDWHCDRPIEIKSQDEWQRLMEANGFTTVTLHKDDFEITNSFWGLFRKESCK